MAYPSYIAYMKDTGVARTAKTIRMRADVYHRARVAAVVAQKSLGQWVEEAIVEKVERDALSA